jgi:predicted small lipoprotein YifL
MKIKTSILLATLTLATLTGCVEVSNQKSLIIPPSDKPVTVTANALTQCYKYPWLHCHSYQKLEASNGQIASDFPDE